jgi:hypothetical protein
MKLTKKDKAIAEQFNNVKPKQFGNLHERMQYLIHMIHSQYPAEFDSDVWNAVLDLRTEVSYYEPKSPPYGHRTV